MHADHLGSPVAATDGAGALLWRDNRTPFGEPWDPQDPANDNNTGFTGHIEDTATGLTYMQARYYDPVTARFLSNDPVSFSADQPQMFGRYTYTFNDPVNMTDPTGQCPNCVTGGIGAAVGGLIGGGIELVNQATDGKPGISVGRVAVSAGKGALAGGVIGATGCVACGAGVAGVAGALDGGVTRR